MVQYDDTLGVGWREARGGNVRGGVIEVEEVLEVEGVGEEEEGEEFDSDSWRHRAREIVDLTEGASSVIGSTESVSLWWRDEEAGEEGEGEEGKREL